MTKLQGAPKLRELATTLASNKQLSNKELCTIKGGCTSCEDTRRPPRYDGGNWQGY